MKREFQAVFQLSKTKIFEVKYYTLSTNKHPHFTTSAAEFCRNKQDYTTCGQAQESVCKGFRSAYNFYCKWDTLHLKDLTEEQYAEMRSDLEKLMGHYNYILEEFDESAKPYSPHFSFYRLAEWTKQKPKH